MKRLFAILFFLYLTNHLFAQLSFSKLDSLLRKDFSVDMQWFLAERMGEIDNKQFNEFTLKRGYVNIKKGINKSLSGRITTDLTVDQEGDGKGDIEIRLKYLYLKTKLTDILFLHKPYFEFGLVHRPWIDFEQTINRYRVQGQLFLERNNVVSSADFGVVFMSMLGGEMDDDYKKKVNKKFAGKYGSISMGVFNGGGYHALENNKTKTFEARFTLRPMPQLVPGLQLTYHGAYGYGNTEQNPHWHYQSGYLSHETQYSVLTFEAFQGKGNYKGSAILDTVSFSAVPQYGFSVFGEAKLLKSKFSAFFRYDDFRMLYTPIKTQDLRYIGGVAYHFSKSKIVLDYEHLVFLNQNRPDAYAVELALELRF